VTRKPSRIALALAAFVLVAAYISVGAQEDSADDMRIVQNVAMRCDIDDVYAALTTPDSFEKFSGYPSSISAVEGGPFSLFGGQITGRNLVLVPNRLIVQAWRVSTWPEGHFSIARFSLSSSDGSTRIAFDQWGYPADTSGHLSEGWRSMYWEPLEARCLESRR
jgi:activator of HSP90 ATPase